jgi:hypothetical protein
VCDLTFCETVRVLSFYLSLQAFSCVLLSELSVGQTHTRSIHVG